MKLKLLPRPDNDTRTQSQWIEFWNNRKIKMMSLPDVWNLFEDKNIEAIQDLRNDWKGSDWQVTSSRIEYSAQDLSGKIIHNTNSRVTKQKIIKLKEIPICQPTYIKELLESEQGLFYIKALIDRPKTTKEKIIEGFEYLSGKSADKIRFWTPTQRRRISNPIRSVGLFFVGFGGFCVVGGWCDDGNGLSRGVLVSSAKQTRFFNNKAIFDTEEKTIVIPMQRKLCKEIEQQQKKTKKVNIRWELKTKIS